MLLENTQFLSFLVLMGTMNWEQVSTQVRSYCCKVHQVIWLVIFQSVYRIPPPIQKPAFCLHIRGLSPTLFSKIEPSQSSLYLRIELVHLLPFLKEVGPRNLQARWFKF